MLRRCHPLTSRLASLSSRHHGLIALAAAHPGAARPWGRPEAIARRGLSSDNNNKKTKVKITFVGADGKDTETVTANVGDSLLDVAHDNDLDVEGACGGEMACSTCHMILEEDVYKTLPKPKEEEEDMLDLAIGLCKTSRLGCQVKVTAAMDGMKVRLPAEVANMQTK